MTDRLDDVIALVEEVRPSFAGKDPEVVGAALAELLATWLTGHHPQQVRPALLAIHVDTVVELAELEAR